MIQSLGAGESWAEVETRLVDASEAARLRDELQILKARLKVTHHGFRDENQRTTIFDDVTQGPLASVSSHNG